MKINELLEGLNVGAIPARFKDFDIQSISCDSRNVEPGGLFFALKGTRLNGTDFIAEALKKGAKVIIKNSHGSGYPESKDFCLLSTSDPRNILLNVAQRFYGFPSRQIKTIGITGTNGKTTISYLLESIFHAASKKCAVIGTVNYRIGRTVIPSKNTTPGLLENQRYLSDMVKEKAEFCIMEVSSHALDQGRVEAIDFCCAIFTNLTGDHLDYHRTMENYFLAKSKLFTGLNKKSCAIINVDDEYGKRLAAMAKGKVITFGLQGKPDVQAENIRLTFSGSTFLIRYPEGKIDVKTKLIGRHNVSNILSASASALSLGISPENIRKGIAFLKGVPGRLERVDNAKGFSVFVDYAHTEDALKNVLSNLKNVSRAKIIVVFGCGGDRDKTKRPKMGKIAGQLADFSIVTSDNPRSEDPQDIVSQIQKGFQGKNFEVVLDRKKAIAKALSMAKAGDVVLIAGKGHEDYQIFKDKTVHFDDREVVKEILGC